MSRRRCGLGFSIGAIGEETQLEEIGLFDIPHNPKVDNVPVVANSEVVVVVDKYPVPV